MANKQESARLCRIDANSHDCIKGLSNLHQATANRKPSIQPRFWFVLFAFVMLLLLIAFIRYGRLYQTQLALADQVRDELNEIAVENAQLRRKLEFMQTEQYIERQARREYGMIVQGDIRFVADVSSFSGVVSAWNSVETPEESPRVQPTD